MNKLTVTKEVISVVTGFGVSVAVNTVVSAALPVDASKIAKIGATIGSLAISYAINSQVDALIAKELEELDIFAKDVDITKKS